MEKKFEVLEFSIVVVARNHNPTVLNPDFLKNNHIVPTEWELAKPPICVEPVAETVFKNKISIVAQLEKVIFSENVKDKNVKNFMIPNIAKTYMNILRHVEYSAVGINQKGHMFFDGERFRPGKFILEKLIAPGPWCEFGNEVLNPSITFNYELEKATCSLTIEEKFLKGDGGEQIPIVMFSSNFHHQLNGETREERLQDLQQVISDWGSDFKLYEHLVNDVFLTEERKDENKPL